MDTVFGDADPADDSDGEPGIGTTEAQPMRRSPGVSPGGMKKEARRPL
jgi:hypothetical protein